MSNSPHPPVDRKCRKQTVHISTHFATQSRAFLCYYARRKTFAANILLPANFNEHTLPHTRHFSSTHTQCVIHHIRFYDSVNKWQQRYRSIHRRKGKEINSLQFAVTKCVSHNNSSLFYFFFLTVGERPRRGLIS